jgi:hypothetical protein
MILPLTEAFVMAKGPAGAQVANSSHAHVDAGPVPGRFSAAETSLSPATTRLDASRNNNGEQRVTFSTESPFFHIRKHPGRRSLRRHALKDISPSACPWAGPGSAA